MNPERYHEICALVIKDSDERLVPMAYYIITFREDCYEHRLGVNKYEHQSIENLVRITGERRGMRQLSYTEALYYLAHLVEFGAEYPDQLRRFIGWRLADPPLELKEFPMSNVKQLLQLQLTAYEKRQADNKEAVVINSTQLRQFAKDLQGKIELGEHCHMTLAKVRAECEQIRVNFDHQQLNDQRVAELRQLLAAVEQNEAHEAEARAALKDGAA